MFGLQRLRTFIRTSHTNSSQVSSVTKPTSPKNSKGVKSFSASRISMGIRADQENLSIQTAKTTDEISKIATSVIGEANTAENSVVIILGGSGHLGCKISEAALKRGWTVYSTTRRKVLDKDNQAKRFTWLTVPGKSVKDPSEWKLVVDKLNLEGKKVLVVNSMGGAHPEGDETLHDLNAKPTYAAFKGISDSLAAKKIAKCSFVQLSSLASVLVKDPYGAIKAEIDLELMDSSTLKNLIILRVSYALEQGEKKIQNIYVDNRHPYGPEQSALLPVQPVLGDGNQTMPMVFTSDVADAVLNSANLEGKHMIDALSGEKITQSELARKFSSMIGKKYRPFHLPLAAAKLLAQHFPMGRFTTCAVEYCEQDAKDIPHEPFEELLGKPAMTVDEGYTIPEGETLEYAKPPVMEHLKLVVRKLASEPQSRKDTAKAISIIFFDLVSKIYKH